MASRRQKGSVIEYRGKRATTFRIKYQDATGRAVMETVHGDRRDAEDLLHDRLKAVREQRYEKPKPITFREFAEQWFAEGEKRDGWKPNTVKTYISVERRLIAAFGPKRLAEVRPRDVKEYVRDMEDGFKASTVGRDLALLHAVYKSAIAEELVDRNPVEGVERPRMPAFRPHILKPAEVQAILRAFTDRRARVVFLTLQLTAIRRHELQALRWGDLDRFQNTLRVRDSKSPSGVRSIALAAELAEELWQWRQSTPYRSDGDCVFADPEHGRKLYVEWYKAQLASAAKAAGVGLPEWTYKDAAGRRRGGYRAFHDVRHGALTNDAAAGVSPVKLKTKAGHSSFSTTERYIHLAGEVFPEEAELGARRLLGALSTEPSTDMSAPDRISGEPTARSEAETGAADVL